MAEADVRMVVLEGVARQARGTAPGARWREAWLRAIAPFSPEEIRTWCRLQWAALEADQCAESVSLASLWGLAPVAAAGSCAQLGELALRLAKHGRYKLVNAIIWTLGAIASGTHDAPLADDADVPAPNASAELADEAIGQLQRLKARIRHRTTARRLDEALLAVAGSRGLGPEALQDLVVEDAGLGPDASRAWEAGPYALYIFLSDDGHAEMAIHERAGGRMLASPPKGLQRDHFAVLSEVKAVQKALSEALITQKQRLEQALESQRGWSWPAWRQVFGRHPLMRHLAKRLLWTVYLEGKLIDTASFNGDELVDRMGDHVTVPEKGELRLLHPVLIDAGALRGWQAIVVQRRMVQPFKQVFREVYRPSAEDLTRGVYSERFEGVVVRHRQMYALLRGRGWSGLAGIGPAGYHGEKIFASAGLSGVIGFHQFRYYPDRARREVTLERLEFYPHPLGDFEPGTDRRMAIAEVSPVVYSEAARDVALVIGVAGIGTEEKLLEGEARREWDGHWRSRLSGVAESRANLLREILPQLGLAGRVQLEGHAALITVGGQPVRLDLATNEARMDGTGRLLDLEGFELSDQPLYLPHEGADAKTAEVIATLLWLAQLADR